MKNLRRYNIRYKQAIQSWDEALPLGNGKLGCLIYGAEPLKISLDRVDLWTLVRIRTRSKAVLIIKIW